MCTSLSSFSNGFPGNKANRSEPDPHWFELKHRAVGIYCRPDAGGQTQILPTIPPAVMV